MKPLAILLSLGALLQLSYQTMIYNNESGIKGLHYSSAAYCAYDTLENWQCGKPCEKNSGLTDVIQIVNPKRFNFAFTGYDSQRNEIVLAFRGTANSDQENWMTNLNGFFVDYPGAVGAKIHLGFYEAYNDMKPQIKNAISRILDKHGKRRPKIFITGHSLGGALGLVAAVDLKDNLLPSYEINLYTYGQPRVGNQKFADHVFSILSKNYVRVTHADDVVPHMPPLILSSFMHSGNEVWFKNQNYDGLYIECENKASSGENGKCSNSLILKTSVESHRYYYGVRVPMQCDRKQTRLKSFEPQEFNSTQSFAEFTIFYQKENNFLE